MDKKVTLEDIAKRAGVSKNTVSVVLRGKPGVSDALRKQILELSASMNYAKGAPVQQKYIMALISNTLNLHISTGSTGLLPRLYFALQNECQKNNCIMIPYSLSADMVKNKLLPSMLHNMDFMGIVTIGYIAPEYIQLLIASGLHVVMAHDYSDEINTDSVMPDDCKAGYIMTKYLISLGHRDIEYFGEKYYMAKYMERWLGYCKAMVENNLPIRYNSYCEVKTDRQTEDNEELYLNKAFSELKSLPTAIVCGEDFTATRIRKLLMPKGVRFPEDISLVGFDDVYHQESDLKITTYRVDHESLIENAVKLLFDKADYPRRVTVFGQPIYRNSAVKLEQGRSGND